MNESNNELIAQIREQANASGAKEVILTNIPTDIGDPKSEIFASVFRKDGNIYIGDRDGILPGCVPDLLGVFANAAVDEAFVLYDTHPGENRLRVIVRFDKNMTIEQVNAILPAEKLRELMSAAYGDFAYWPDMVFSHVEDTDMALASVRPTDEELERFRKTCGAIR
jgi:hypothetical protein